MSPALTGPPPAFAGGLPAPAFETVGADAGPGAPPRASDADPASDEVAGSTERSGFTKVITGVAVVGSLGKSILLDRARGAVAFPHARSQGKTAKWAAEMVTAKFTNDVVPIAGGTIKVAGKTLTTNGWARSYQASNGIGIALLGVGMIYGFPNLIEGWHDGGGTVGGLAETKQGRTGVLATAGNIFQLSLLTAAYAGAPAGPGRFGRMLRSPLLSSTPMVLAGIAIGLPVALNELGFFDFMNKGNDTSIGQNTGDTLARHWTSIRGFPTSVAEAVTGVLHLD